MYGICRVSNRSAKVSNAINVAKEIRKKNFALAKEERKNFLVSSGLTTDGILICSSESDDTLSDYSDCTELSDNSDEYHDGKGNDYNFTSVKIENAKKPISGLSFPTTDKPEAHHSKDLLGETGVKRSYEIQSNSNVNSRDWSEIEMTALDELREVSWNWFAFFKVLEKTFETHDYTPELFDQFAHFAVRLPNLGLHEEGVRLTEQVEIGVSGKPASKRSRLGKVVGFSN